MTTSAVLLRPGHADHLRQDWERLNSADPSPDLFGAELLAGLPEPARRWLAHAIAPGTPLWSSVQLQMHGRIKLGEWRRFDAEQVIAPPDGYIWAATAHVLGLPVSGYDRLSGGTAEMRWHTLGMVPVMHVDGPDILRSAAGRLASEFVMVPTTFRGATWSAGSGPDRAVATWLVEGQPERVELTVGLDGRLLRVLLQRWGNPGGQPFGRYPFGVDVLSEQTFAGVTIPTRIRAGWSWGTAQQDEGEFFRATITQARFA